MKKIIMASAIVFGLATSAIAHDDVANAAVSERMHGMAAISAAMKTLGDMAKGSVEFDAVGAQAAVDAVAAQAAAIPTLFEPEETDPKSDAKAEIWTNWDDFISKASVLQTAAESVIIEDKSSVGAALGAIGGTCKACHSKFRM
jgi:cytochrome c556